MGKITRTAHVAHDKGCRRSGLLRYIMAASNRTAGGDRGGRRGRDLYRMVVHRTGFYQTRFPDHIMRSVH